MLIKLNERLNSVMPFLAPVSVVLGVLLSGHIIGFAFLITWIFAFISFTGSLNSNFHSLQKTFLNPLPIIVVLIVLHIIMPIWAWSVGHITFNGDMLTIIGLLLSMAIPTGITSFIWVSIHKGNIALTFSTVIIDTILSPVLVPLTLSLFVGASVDMEIWSMMRSLVGMVVLPSVLAMTINHISKGRAGEVWSPRLSPFSKLGLMLVIMINSAVVAPYLSNINWKLVWIAAVVFFIAASGYLLSWCIGTLLNRDRDEVIALTFSGGMRNISAGSVIAVTYFPPPVAVPVVIGMLFQQVLASIYGFLLRRLYGKPSIAADSLQVHEKG
ncbi:bile acid:sodium symporter family protein [Sediminibacillus massiliensis]|uniref:bile acid:sodium symporter family protein n=1 Tax=Sediminibacillus massiliensis TaxID=1926277 RepID=UPI0009887989|nr:bile acid:sodium symporter family protein [Sediminibacillus massiliensis]